jgi:hypothetical protein
MAVERTSGIWAACDESAERTEGIGSGRTQEVQSRYRRLKAGVERWVAIGKS